MRAKCLPYQYTFLKKIEDAKNILVIVAMESEETAMLSSLTFKEIVYGVSTKIRVRQLALPRGQVSIARCGVGLVNAGVLLALILEHQKVDAVVLLGVGGALDTKLNVGDTVIARQIIQHDSLLSAEDGSYLIAPGELTLSATPDQQVDPVMRCDLVLVQWIASAIGLSHRGKVFEGTIVSGSEFVANPAKKQVLRTLAEDALLVDMEAAALAQVARRLKLPFVAAKTVADRAVPGSSISHDYKTFLEAAAAHSGSALQGLLRSFG